MVRDIFISYVKEDKSVADKICANLESYGLQCWIAPRNIAEGEKYASAAIHAIDESKIVVVVFSRNTDQSVHVRTEIERAFNHTKIIIPFRIENIEPSDEVRYFIGSRQWLDAFSGSLDEHTNQLADIIMNHFPADSNNQRSREYSKSSKINQSRVNNDNISQKTKEYMKISPLLSRLIAFIIDLVCGYVFSTIVFIVIGAGLTFVIGTEGYNNLMFFGDENSSFGTLIFTFIMFVCMVLFLAIFDILKFYESPGKKLMSLKIVTLPPFPKYKIWSVIRYFTKIPPLILMMLGAFTQFKNLGGFIFLIGLILQIIWGISIYITPNSQSIHDLVAGTVVISEKK